MRPLFFILLTCMFPVSAGLSASAERAVPLKIERACVVEPPPGSPNGVAFMTITNITERSVTIAGVETPVARKAEIHRTVRRGERSSMMHVKTLTLLPAETIEFSHGRYHIMLIGLERRPQRGQRVKLVFHLKEGGTVSVDARVCGMKTHRNR